MRREPAPVATTIIYEDDHDRAWNHVVPAGATIEKHKHDYVPLNVAGAGPTDVPFHTGSGGEISDRLTFSPTARTAGFVAKGHGETGRNDGDE